MDIDMATIDRKNYHFRNVSKQGRSSPGFVLDGLKLSESKKAPGTKAPFEYNGLRDKNLVQFFMKPTKKKDLYLNGLITEKGNIVPSFELNKQNYKYKN
jgi:hypothetical protein